MTEQSIRDMVSEFATVRKQAEEEARWIRTHCPDYCVGSLIFSAVTWDMSLERDRAFDSAYLTLQKFGFR